MAAQVVKVSANRIAQGLRLALIPKAHLNRRMLPGVFGPLAACLEIPLAVGIWALNPAQGIRKGAQEVEELF